MMSSFILIPPTQAQPQWQMRFSIPSGRTFEDIADEAENCFLYDFSITRGDGDNVILFFTGNRLHQGILLSYVAWLYPKE